MRSDKLLVASNAPEVSNAAAFHALPVHINKLLLLVFQYNAPVSNALPSLSVLGAEDLAPKYLSSKLSNDAAAAFWLTRAAAAELDELVAEVPALVALVAALAAEVAAEVALPKMPST